MMTMVSECQTWLEHASNYPWIRVVLSGNGWEPSKVLVSFQYRINKLRRNTEYGFTIQTHIINTVIEQYNTKIQLMHVHE
jgi:hypothetical protein